MIAPGGHGREVSAASSVRCAAAHLPSSSYIIVYSSTIYIEKIRLRADDEALVKYRQQILCKEQEQEQVLIVMIEMTIRRLSTATCEVLLLL